MQGFTDGEYTDELECLLKQILALWLHGREYRIAIGRLLIRLHELLCRPGYGSFIKTVTEPPPVGLRMPYTTARD